MSKKCTNPKCGGRIVDDAKICPHCKVLVDVEDSDSPRLSASQEARLTDVLRDKLSHSKSFLWLVSWRVLWAVLAIFGITAVGVYSKMRAAEDAVNQRVDAELKALNSQVNAQLSQTATAVYARVEKEFEEPRIGKVVEAVAERRATQLLEDKINPQVQAFRASVADKLIEVEMSKQRIVTLEKEITQIRSDLTASYTEILKETDLFRLSNDAKLGDRKAFDVIYNSAQTQTNHLGLTAKSLLGDISYHYGQVKDEWESPFAKKIKFVHAVTGKPFRVPIDALLLVIAQFPKDDNRVSQVGIFSTRDYKHSVETLVGIVRGDPNLKIASIAVCGIEFQTGLKFGSAPPFEDVITWWQTSGRTNDLYGSPIPRLKQWFSELSSKPDSETTARLVLDHGEQLVTDYNGLGRVHAALAQAYIQLNDPTKAKEHFKKVEEECDGEIDAMRIYASLVVKEKDNKRAIAILSKIIPYLPDKPAFETGLRADPVFADLVSTPEFKALFAPAK